MDLSAKEDDNGPQRGRSFRYEDYNNRRVFLRSYPLHWDDQEEVLRADTVETREINPIRISNCGLKRKFLHALRWGKGKVLLLRKLKHKLALYLVPCHPLGLKPFAFGCLNSLSN